MKIAMVGQKVVPSRDGGIEVVVEALSSEMLKKGHSLTLFNRKRKHNKDNPKISEYNGAKIIETFTLNRRAIDAYLYSFCATVKVRQMAKRGKFDVVHFHSEGACAFLNLFPNRKKRNYKIVVTVHGIDWMRGKWKGIGAKVIKNAEKKIVKYADEIIVLSESVKTYFKKNYNRETIFIPNGVYPPTLKAPEYIKETFNLAKDEYVLTVARIVPEKRIKELIEAWKTVREKTGTEKKLVIVGGESHSKDYYNEVVALCKNDESIILTGFMRGQPLEELFSNAYLYVQASDLEGMSMALLEARAYGNTCLVSSIPENADVVGENDYVFKVNDKEDLEKKLSEIILKKLTTHTKLYLANTWESIADMTLDVYKR